MLEEVASCALRDVRVASLRGTARARRGPEGAASQAWSEDSDSQLTTHNSQLLVLALAPFADAALLVGPLAARRAARPDERVTVAAPPGVCDVLAALGLADACWEVSSQAPAPGEVFDVARLLYRARRERFDEVVDLFPHLRSLLASRLAAPARGASRAPAAFVDAAFRLRARVFGAYDPIQRIARLLGAVPGEPPRFGVDPDSDAWLERALAATGYRGGEPILVVHSGGLWPDARFVEVAGRLRSAMDVRVVVVDTPREGSRARVLAGALGGTVLGLGAPSARRFFSAVSRASAVVTDDAGVAYLAGLVRAPALLVARSGRPLPPGCGCDPLTAADVADVTVEAVYDAACKLVRRERTGPLFGGF
jgi:ADP-heptose:LPS heptosyltransferase